MIDSLCLVLLVWRYPRLFCVVQACCCFSITDVLNRLTPNDPYIGLTARLTSKRCILYIYSTNISTEYFKHALYSPFLSLQNAVCFIMLNVWFLYYSHFIYRCAEIKKKNNSGAKRLMLLLLENGLMSSGNLTVCLCTMRGFFG